MLSHAPTTIMKACHEIGHTLIALIYGIEIIAVSIRGGDDINANMSFVNGGNIVRTDMFQVLLAGWAAEAYYLSHERKSPIFDAGRFRKSLSEAKAGIGHRHEILWGGNRDAARAMRLCPIRSLYRTPTLLQNARMIHDRRDRFYAMVDVILEEYRVTGEYLRSIMLGGPHCPAGRVHSRNAEFDSLFALK